MKKMILIITCTAFMLGTGLAMASTPPPEDKSTAIESTQLTKNLIFHGTVEKIKEGTALNTDKGLYPLLGGDFDMIIGKQVNIIGKMINEGGTEKIAVSRIQFDKE